MSDVVIRVESLSKRYTIRHANGGRAGDGLRHALQDAAARPLRALCRRISAPASSANDQPSSDEFYALKNVSFEVKRGEVLGIIGRNGAGKSTLLKILSRITEPTRGQIAIKGKVASLLEVGTGFHPDLTGRENIFLNGAILGMTRGEVKAKFDEIVDFAGVDRFLDMPVKRYSSGMYVRLAFAVAAHLEPEILVVDEVLAVGDAKFQKKCLGKMKEAASKEGRTVIFVSHNMGAVVQLTSVALVFEQGKISHYGTPTDAVQAYATGLFGGQIKEFDVQKKHRKYFGTGSASFVTLSFAREIPVFAPDDDFEFVAKIRTKDEITKARCSITIYASDGNAVGSCFGLCEISLPANVEAEVHITLPAIGLAPGHYDCGLAIGEGDHTTGHQDFDVISHILAFEICAERGADGALATWDLGWGKVIFPRLRQRVISVIDQDG